MGTSGSGFDNGAEIVAKYWYVIDADHSDSLSWDEWRYTQAAFAAVDSLVVLEAFDADENGMMDSSVSLKSSNLFFKFPFRSSEPGD